MKVLICFAALLLARSVSAQQAPLYLQTNKTTSLVFPSAIKHIDRGSKEVLVYHVKNAGNVLLLKAANVGLQETNLSVVTEDGAVYVFDVFYGTGGAGMRKVAEKKMEMESKGEKGRAGKTTFARNSKAGVELSLHTLLIEGSYIGLGLRLSNSSLADFSVAYLHFFLRDKRRRQGAASQEIEIHPLRIEPTPFRVEAGTATRVNVHLEKFTIPKKKMLVVELGEEGGGPPLRMKISAQAFIKASQPR